MSQPQDFSFLSSPTDNVERTESSKKRSKIGLVAVGVSGAVAVGLMVISAPFVTPAFRRVCLPYVPATDNQVNNILRLTRGRNGNLVDLGSGDGRVVLAAAKNGFSAVGYELNPWLVWYSRLQAIKQGLHSRAKFQRADLWKINLSSFDNLVIFGVSEMMPDLTRKLESEMNKEGRVIACRFPLCNWKPCAVIEEGIDSVWMYKKPCTTS